MRAPKVTAGRRRATQVRSHSAPTLCHTHLNLPLPPCLVPPPSPPPPIIVAAMSPFLSCL